MPPHLSLYNQSSQTDDDFVESFVARHDVLETLLRRLRTEQPNVGELHHILIGQRGMGKTSLLRRLAIAINRDPYLCLRYVPLSFREEQYNVLSLGSFWRNCGEALAEWAEATGRTDFAARLDAAMTTPAWVGDGSGETFNTEIAALQRRAVLLVDNIDLILDALKSEDNWRLRRHFQDSNGPVVIGGATQPLKQSADRDAAFYEFFQPHYLEPLDERETERCMRTLAERRGSHGGPVLEVLNTQPERLKTLHTLTGGNPRVLALIYRLLEAAESDVAMADLEILLDQVTPYYKARIEEYQSAQQRAVIDAIALNWDPITTGRLSGVTSIVTTSLSSVLDKLKKDGLIENVDTSGSYAGHQLAERFFNIWYLMRHGTRRAKQKMRWLVRFLTSFYSLNELSKIASRGRTNNFHADYSVALEEALEQQHKQGSRGTSPFEKISTIEIKNDSDADNLLSDIFKLDAVAEEGWRKNDLIKCKNALEEIITHFANAEKSEVRRQVARALFNKAGTLGRMGDSAAAIATYDELLARFTGADKHAFLELITKALFNKAVRLGRMGDSAAAIATYDDLLGRLADVDEHAFRRLIGRALLNKAIKLGQIGDSGAAIATYDDIVARFATTKEPALREQVANALGNKAIALSQKGDSAAAIAVYDDILVRFADAKEPALREQFGRALANKAVTLGKVGDGGTAIAIYDDILVRFADAKEPALRELIARVLVNKAGTLGNMGDYAASIATCDDILARFANAKEPALREQVANALGNKAIALGQKGDSAAAIAIYDDIVVRFADAKEPALREQVANALGNKAIALGQKGDSAAAIAIYDDILIRLADAKEPALRELIAKALVNKATTLGTLGDSAAAISIYDDILVRFADAKEPALQEIIAKALVNKAGTLGNVGDSAAAIATYDDIIMRFANAEDPTLRELLARARIHLANLLIDTREEIARAEALYLEVDPSKDILASANLAWLLVLAGRASEAVELQPSLEKLPLCGRALLEAGLELVKDNFGSATKHLAVALDEGLEAGGFSFSSDVDRLIRLAERKSYGERLVAWFEDSGMSDRVAPIYVALKAYIRGVEVLLDVNPEVRQPAKIIYDRLDAPRRYKDEKTPKDQKKRKRGRPSKSRSRASE